MLPLAILPGRGAELYQGLGIALTGGLALSTLQTSDWTRSTVKISLWLEIAKCFGLLVSIFESG